MSADKSETNCLCKPSFSRDSICVFFCWKIIKIYFLTMLQSQTRNSDISKEVRSAKERKKNNRTTGVLWWNSVQLTEATIISRNTFTWTLELHSVFYIIYCIVDRRRPRLELGTFDPCTWTSTFLLSKFECTLNYSSQSLHMVHCNTLQETAPLFRVHITQGRYSASSRLTTRELWCCWTYLGAWEIQVSL